MFMKFQIFIFLVFYLGLTRLQDSQPLIKDLSKIESTFQQLRNLTRIIVQPPETIKIPLQDYFRGQNLTYNVELKCNNPDHDKNHSLLMKDQDVFQFSQSMKELHFIDFEQQAEEHSLPQTTLLYTDSNQNKYLIFVDFGMILNIYNISLYYLAPDLDIQLTQKHLQSQVFDSTINRIVFQDLNDKNQGFAPEKQCNNLLQIDEYKLIVNCMAQPVKNQKAKSILIDIDISNLPKVGISYFKNDIEFEIMRDGYLELFELIDQTYFILQRENTTNTQINIMRYTPSKEFRVDTIIDKFELEGLENTKLQIQDVKRIHFMDDLIIASDYNLGILLWYVNCHQKNLETTCVSQSYYRLATSQANTITILDALDNFEERVMFIQRIYPPQILEMSYQLGAKPFIQKIYKIPQDLNQYTSMSLLDANKEFILTQLVSIQQFKPLIRAYQRQSSFYQILHSEFKYSQFIDSGVFIQFINQNENFFVLKTSDFFKIFVLQNIEFSILAQNLTILQEKQLLDHQMQLYISVQNYTYGKIQTVVDILFINRTKTTAMLLYLGTKQNQTSLEPLQLIYSCGDLKASHDLDQYFSGPENDYRINYLKSDEDFFIINNRISGIEPQLLNYKYQDCSLNSMITLQELKSKSYSRYLSCVSFDGNQITIIDVFGVQQIFSYNIKSSFKIPNARIVESVIDEFNNKMIVFSKTTVDEQQGIVLHSFNLFNVIMWEASVDLVLKYPQQLQNFEMRANDPIQFNAKNLIGAIISKIYFRDDSKHMKPYTKIAIFSIQAENALDFASLLEIIEIDLNEDTRVLQTKFTDDFVWVLLSDHQFIVYEKIQVQTGKTTYKTQFRLKRILDISEKVDPQMQQIINFKISDSRVIAFFQNRTVALYDYDYYTLDFERKMILPMYLDKFPDYSYEFVVNNLTKKVAFDSSGDILFVLYTRYQLKYFDGYTIFVYNTENRRHNTLLQRYNIPGRFVDNVDVNMVRIQVLLLEDNLFRVTITSEQSEFFHFKIRHKSQLLVNPNRVEVLNMRCQKDKTSKLKFQIYSTDNPKDILDITMNAENRGLKVYNELDRDNVTISLEKNSLLKIDNQENGKYQLLKNFHGFNMEYNQTCIIQRDLNDSNPPVNTICQDVQLNQRNQESNKTIEFSSNDNPILGFFIIDDVFIFFDKSYIRVFLPETQQYEQRSANDVFQYANENPLDYYLFSFQDFRVGSTLYYLGTLDEKFHFSLSKILLPSTSDIDLHIINNYVNFNDRIYLKPVKDSLELPTKLTSLEMQRKSIELFLGIFVYDPQNQNTLSTIELYHIHVKQAIDITFEKISVKDLTLNSLYLDNFKINAVKIFNNSNMLIVGIESFGVMIFNLDTFQIERVISVKQTIPNVKEFKISSIVYQTMINFKLIIPKIGIISLLFEDSEYQNLNKIKPEFFDSDIDLKSPQTAAVGPSGFGYIEGVIQDSDKISQLRYFCWDAQDHTKSIGTYPLAKNTNCNFVQELSWKTAKLYFNMDVNIDFQCQTVICESTLKIICFNFHPSLLISPKTASYLQEVSNQTIIITAHNQYSNETMYLDIFILRQSRAVATGYYAGILVFIALCMLWGFKQTKEKMQKDIKKKEKRNQFDPQERDNRSFLSKVFKRKSRLNFEVPKFDMKGSHLSSIQDQDRDSEHYKYSEVSSKYSFNPSAIN
eukprot:403358058